jgi:hypothetical protein
MNYPSPEHTWKRIARAISVYGGEFDNNFYQKLIAQNQCPAAVAELQSQGVQFKADDCFHWGLELCGAFEITHPRYTRPKGSDAQAADILYGALLALFNEDR